jgi:hypothetical protein
MVLDKEGNWSSRKGSIRDLLKMIKNKEKEFDTYLVARRVNEDYNSYVNAKNTLETIIYQFNLMEEGKEKDKLQKVIDAGKQEIEKLNSILKNDAFNVHDAAEVVRKYEKQFEKPTKLFDDITKSLIDFSESTGLLKSSLADKYRKSKGYAPFFRFINDELISENIGTLPSSNSQTKAKIFKKRVGSKHDIVSPVYNQMMAISEIIGKGLENNIWRNVVKIANINKEIARRFEQMELNIAVDKKGDISFPQDNDPNLIKVWIDGKRSYYKIAPEFAAVAKNLRGEEWTLFRQAIQLPSALFTRLTTSANPVFALGNLPVDQISQYMQSKTKIRPILDTGEAFIELIKAASKLSTEEETEFRKYIRIGGRRQTFAAFHGLTPEQTISKIVGASTFEKALQKMDLGLTFLELPSNTSEYLSRFAEYNRAKNQGRSDTEAMFMASQVTVPFQLYGNWYGSIGKSWIKALPYFNASLQVNYKFFKTVKEQPERVIIAGAALLATSLSMGLLSMASARVEQ